MPWEDIGSCGDGQMPDERDWVVTQLELGIRYLKHVCGPPPAGCELGIMWHEHELGDYTTIGLFYECGDEPPCDYVSSCESVLLAFDEAIDWSAIHPERIRERALELSAPAAICREFQKRCIAICRQSWNLIRGRMAVRPRRALTSSRWRIRAGRTIRRSPRHAE